MMILPTAVFGVAGLFSIAGGILGFKKAGSRASLIAGGISGVLLLAASGCVAVGLTSLGLGLGGLTSVLLAGRFAPAYIKTRKVMPQGVMTALSAAGAAAAALGYFLR